MTPETLEQVTELLGVNDPAGIACEPFFQWVIEDNFVNGRPSWEKAGAELVQDVLPYEEMKLRMLNGSHSFLAYLGYLAAYADALLQRYRNRALKHRTWQIAMDGSQKLPQRMLDSIRWHLAHGSRFDMLALGVAGWMRYVGGVDEQGNAIDISDPLRDLLADVVRNSAQGEARVPALLGMEAIAKRHYFDNSQLCFFAAYQGIGCNHF